MIKYVCDRCSKESYDVYNVVKFPCHIAEKKHGYIDVEGNEVSGRMVEKGLCNQCYNLVMQAAFNVFKS